MAGRFQGKKLKIFPNECSFGTAQEKPPPVPCHGAFENPQLSGGSLRSGFWIPLRAAGSGGWACKRRCRLLAPSGYSIGSSKDTPDHEHRRGLSQTLPSVFASRKRLPGKVNASCFLPAPPILPEPRFLPFPPTPAALSSSNPTHRSALPPSGLSPP